MTCAPELLHDLVITEKMTSAKNAVAFSSRSVSLEVHCARS